MGFPLYELGSMKSNGEWGMVIVAVRGPLLDGFVVALTVMLMAYKPGSRIPSAGPR